MSLTIEKNFDKTDKSWHFKLGGELDISNSGRLKNELNDAYVEIPADIALNIADLGYMDSTGLGIFIGIYGKVKKSGHKISLIEPRENIKKLFRITNLDKTLL